jgi:4-hydroxybenzoate polyprenyltransferase
MPYWTTLLIALGGLLLGGAWSLRKQDFPLWTQIGFVVCAVMAIVAGILLAQ